MGLKSAECGPRLEWFRGNRGAGELERSGHRSRSAQCAVHAWNRQRVGPDGCLEPLFQRGNFRGDGFRERRQRNPPPRRVDFPLHYQYNFTHGIFLEEVGGLVVDSQSSGNWDTGIFIEWRGLVENCVAADPIHRRRCRLGRCPSDRFDPRQQRCGGPGLFQASLIRGNQFVENGWVSGSR